MDMRAIRAVSPITEYLYSKSAGAGIPISGTFELSPVCNFACKMCYVRKTAAEVKAHTRPAVSLSQWLQIAREARQAGMLYLLLTGGEPLLWPDFWTLYEELIKMGFLVSINTNGSLIDDAAIERFRRLPPARINITLYGASDETYEALCAAKGVFAKVDHAIRGLKKAGIMLRINSSLTPQNVCDQEAIIRYAQEQDILLAMVEYMFPPLRRDPSMVGQNERFTPEQAACYQLRKQRLLMAQPAYRSFLSSIVSGCSEPLGLADSCVDPVDGKIRCRAGKASFWITWDGWLTACGMMPYPRVELIGKPFADAWGELRKAASETPTSGVCASCSNQTLCHACAAMATAETGKSNGTPLYLCRMAEELRKIAIEELKTLDAENM